MKKRRYLPDEQGSGAFSWLEIDRPILSTGYSLGY